VWGASNPTPAPAPSATPAADVWGASNPTPAPAPEPAPAPADAWGSAAPTPTPGWGSPASSPLASPVVDAGIAGSLLTRGMFQGAVPTFITAADGGSEFTGIARPSTYNVLDGHGTPLSPLGFAKLTGDTALVEQIVLEKRLSTGGMVGGTIAGVSMLVAGALEVRGGDALLSSPATASASALDAGSDRVRGGTALLVTGGLVTVFSQLQAVVVRIKQSYMPTYFTGSELDARIRAYNARLRADFGLLDQDEATVLVPRPRPTVRPRLGIGFFGLDGSF